MKKDELTVNEISDILEKISPGSKRTMPRVFATVKREGMTVVVVPQVGARHKLSEDQRRARRYSNNIKRRKAAERLSDRAEAITEMRRRQKDARRVTHG